ncbi:M20 metallopeptidase family protein [Helicovermis profundi]|uniref:N-acetyldiaminopimelate deacetylase n=1 Tax=Helicovermis profundi TaxID=3065157 RepID=A0AAU9EJ69_9FIRM|nr:N-acetyldiaminopimelate deacetylase [Clostridia bacterium S502]
MYTEIFKFKDEITSLRRELHKIPESGFNEEKTSKFIRDYLDSISIKYKTYAKTGVIGYITIDENLPSIAFRSDMDALSMHELTKHDFKSTHEGFMHACGHDGHMAMLLIFAKYMSSRKDKLTKNIVFIFQPAEEGPGGAEVLLKEGLKEDFNIMEFIGIHLYPETNAGDFSLKSGPMMAMTGEFDIEITGKSGHGAMPHKSLDAIVLSVELIQSFQNIISRTIDPVSPAVLTIGRMECGERRNIIAESAILEGTLRAFDDTVYNLIKEKMLNHAKGLEISYGCKVNTIFRDMYPPVVNDINLYNDFINANKKSFNIELIDPQMLAEDFSYYQKSTPGLFIFLGIRNKEKGHIFPLHSSKFNFDEEILLTGVQSYINLLEYKKILINN